MSSFFITLLVTSFFFFFFFYCSGDHRDLHSFPTRRSSDLISVATRAALPRPVRSQAESTVARLATAAATPSIRSEEHTSELQSRFDLVCRLLLEKKKK